MTDEGRYWFLHWWLLCKYSHYCPCLRPDLSRQNAQWVWLISLTEIRIVACLCVRTRALDTLCYPTAPKVQLSTTFLLCLAIDLMRNTEAR